MTAVAAKSDLYELLDTYGGLSFERRMDLAAFTALSEAHPDLIVEREASGKVLIMSPVKAGSGGTESDLNYFIQHWNRSNDKPGKVYSPSTGFLLAGEEVRCGDSVWVSMQRIAPFLADPDHAKKWVDVCPDFVVEVRSSTDRLKSLQRKMTNVWLANGARLGWLIDTENEVVYIYRAGKVEPEEVRDFDHAVLSGEEVMPGFELPLVELQ